MSVRAINFVEGEYYHVYNRGNSKQIIFHDDQDYQHLIHLFNALNTKTRLKIGRIKELNTKESGEIIISIGAYCLMPNHFHILIKQEKENGISTFMQKVSTAYVMYYNKKYKRTGSLFEGKFKSKYAGEDSYLKYLFAYIHLNPLKILDSNWKSKARYMPKEMISFLVQYKYSSFHEYFSGIFYIINKNAFPDYFPNKESLVKSITSWFTSSDYL